MHRPADPNSRDCLLRRREAATLSWHDDIGTWNVGAYTHGMVGRTPSIDSITANGILFTDHYGQPSCTAGRGPS